MKVFLKALMPGLFFCATTCFSQTGSVTDPDAIPERVLVVMGNSYMEKAVSSIVKDSLTARGYGVDIVSKRKLNSQDKLNYRAVILFSAILAADLAEDAKKLIRSQEGAGRESNLLICTTYGEKWDTQKQNVSAVASATKTLKPEIVARKILSNFDALTGN
jgi:hypothetical protein